MTTPSVSNSIPQLRAERTPGMAAVSRNGQEARDNTLASPFCPSAGQIPGARGTESPPGVGGTGKPKRSKVQKLARRAAWLRGAGSYVHIGQYYHACEADGLKAKLEGCSHTWVKESKGDLQRWRGIGCGERDICPVCGSYHQWVLANEASESMLLAQTGVEVGGVQLESCGLKLVLTIPKTESARIDGLLWTDAAAWQSELNRLFKLGYDFVKRYFGAGCGGVVSVDYTGESSPAEGHYHVNIYVFPARRVGSRWVPLGRWIDEAELAKMRAVWTGMVNKAFGLQLADADFQAGYLGKVGQVKAWLQYTYKHTLSDLWRGWQGVEDGQVNYRVGKAGKEIMLTGGDLTKMCERLPVRYKDNERVSVGLIPPHFKRIRWFGVFSDGQRAKTMDSLGLEPVEVEGDGDDGSDKWQREGAVARFVRYEPAGVVLREVQRDDNGDIIQDMIILKDGWPVWRERLGPEFIVPDSQADYRPSGVAIGKRKRWREPGGNLEY